MHIFFLTRSIRSRVLSSETSEWAFLNLYRLGKLVRALEIDQIEESSAFTL
jgi:hypothetical protein